MKRFFYPIQIITGLLLVILIINDFVPLLVEYLTGVSGFKLPIKFSPGGWQVKFWMIDHPPVFSLYQVLFMATGIVLILSAVFRRVSNKLRIAVIGGLILSALVVILFPKPDPAAQGEVGVMAYIIQQTPKPFMWAQIVAALALIPTLLNAQNILAVRNVAILTAAFLCVLLLLVSLIKSQITLMYAVFPVLGVGYLLLTKNKVVS